MSRVWLLLCVCLPLVATAQVAAVQSVKALRDAAVVRQQFDYSCGSAALATLLTYGLDDPVDEASILAAVEGSLSEQGVASLRERGLSLLDLVRFAQSRGYRAQGFTVAADQITRIRRPVIVFIRPHGYEHFAVLKGVRGERAYLADPASGNVRMPLYQFLAMWSGESGRGVVLAVEPVGRAWPAHSPLALGGARE